MKFIKDFKSFRLNEDNDNYNIMKLELKMVLGDVSKEKITGAKWQLLYDGTEIERGVTDINFSTIPQTPIYIGDLEIRNEKSPVKTLKFSISKEDAKKRNELIIKQTTTSLRKTNFLEIEQNRGFGPAVKPSPVGLTISEGFEIDSSALKADIINEIKEKLAAAKLDKTITTLAIATGATLEGIDGEEILTKKEGTPKRKDYDYNLVVQRYATLKSLLEGEGYKVRYAYYPRKEGKKVYGVYQKFNTNARDLSNRNLVISSTLHTEALDNLKYVGV